MPTSHDILAGLTTVANQWQIIAIGWHLLLTVLIVAICLGWRPSARLASVLLAWPLASVSALAWSSGNPFNGDVFATLALALVGLGVQLPAGRVPAASPWLVGSGAVLVVFGWVYPHFLDTESWQPYLYAAPLGVVPCPTLSAVIGVVFILGMSRFRAWSAALAGVGVLYGAIGWFRLGVTIDVALLIGAAMLAGVAAAGPVMHDEVNATVTQNNRDDHAKNRRIGVGRAPDRVPSGARPNPSRLADPVGRN